MCARHTLKHFIKSVSFSWHFSFCCNFEPRQAHTSDENRAEANSKTKDGGGEEGDRNKERKWVRERERKNAKHTFSNYKSFLMKTPSSNSSSSLHQPLTRRNCLHPKSELMNCWDAFTTLRNQKISIGWKMEKNRIYFCVDKVSNFRQ